MRTRQLILTIVLLAPLVTSGQTDGTEKRMITGHVFDKATKSTPIGANVIQYKTTNGTIIEKDGTFGLSVQKGDTVLIHIAFCFESYYIQYLPTENFKEIILGKKLKKDSEKTIGLWTKRK